MAQISGKAKRFNGEPVDYVLLFDWVSGNCIGKAIPNSLGEWEYNHTSNLNCGITYVADGCGPITHGSYSYAAVMPADTILHYDFNGDVLDKSIKGLNGIKTGTTNFVAGRKAGTQAIEFINGCVRTPSFLPIGTNKFTVSFWMKSTGNAAGNTGVIYESSQDYNASANSFIGIIEDKVLTSATVKDVGLNYNQVTASIPDNNGFHHVVVEVNRDNGGVNQQKIYIDGLLSSVVSATENNNATGIFFNNILYIGQRGASSLPFAGLMQDFRFYNRVLSADERAVLFNE